MMKFGVGVVSFRHCAWLVGLLVAGSLKAETVRSYFTSWPATAAGIWTNAAIQINEVTPGSPAEEGGVRAGDRVIGANGRRIRTKLEMDMLKTLMVGDGGLRLHVIRDGIVKTLAIPRLDKGRLGVGLAAPRLGVDLIAYESFGIRPAEYLGTQQGGRPDGGALDELLAKWSPNISNDHHPVFFQMAVFPAQASERIHFLAEAKKPGARAWVLALLKANYALIESRPADALRHLNEGKLLTTPMDPFLDGLVDFYSKLAAHPPDDKTGVDLKLYGVTPEYFAVCFPSPVLPLKKYDWSAVSAKFAADFARASEGQPWEAAQREQAASYYAAPESQPVMNRYLHYMLCAMIDSENHGGWPMRFTPMFEPTDRADLLSSLKAYAATSKADRVVSALALISPSAVDGDTDAYRQAMTTLRDAGSSELGLGNSITMTTWAVHQSVNRSAIDKIQREINDSLGIPGIYKWLASQNSAHATRLNAGWYVLEYEGLLDGTTHMRTAATVHALGGPQELMPSSGGT